MLPVTPLLLLAKWSLLATADFMSTNGFVLHGQQHSLSPEKHWLLWAPGEALPGYGCGIELEAQAFPIQGEATTLSLPWVRQTHSDGFDGFQKHCAQLEQLEANSGEGDLWNPSRDRECLGTRKLKAIICTPDAFAQEADSLLPTLLASSNTGRMKFLFMWANYPEYSKNHDKAHKAWEKHNSFHTQSLFFSLPRRKCWCFNR